MSVQHVVITGIDEECAPPSREIEIAVIGQRVFITVYDGSDQNVPSDRKKAYEVPVLALHDLIAALSAFGAAVHAFIPLPEQSPNA